MDPLVNVIIPVYKVEDYLDECVQSVVNQTYRNLEIILIDDGSPDNCPKMCDEWAKKDSRIQVIHKSNGGLSSARNAGLAVAKGEYISFVDSDDYVDTTMVEDCVRLLENAPECSIAFFPIIEKDENHSCIWNYGDITFKHAQKMSFNEVLLMILRGGLMEIAWNKLYRRDFIVCPFEEGRTNEDTLFAYQNSKAAVQRKNEYAIASDTPHYTYRRREGSITRSIDYANNPHPFDRIINFEFIAKDCKNWSKDLFQIPYRRLSEELSCIYSNILLDKDYWALSKSKCLEVERILSDYNVFLLEDCNWRLVLRFFLIKHFRPIWKFRVQYLRYCRHKKAA